MATRSEQPLNGIAHRPASIWTVAGPGLAALGVATVAGFLLYPDRGMLLVAGWLGLGLAVAGFQRPAALIWLIWIGGLLNYGVPAGGAIVKPTEGIQAAMAGVILMRLAAGDAELRERLRRVGWLAALLGALGLMAAATAAPHPNAFNARYEVLNYITLLYALLFFKAREWVALVVLFAVSVGVEAAAALGLKFGLGITGLDFLGAGGGARPYVLGREEMEALSGGRFRLSGTMSHKNMLAAFFVLLLPLLVVRGVRRPRLAWLVVILPALAALGLTDSMTGWAAFIVAMTLMLLMLRRFDYLAAMVLLVIPVAAVGLYQFGEPIFFRIRQLLGSQAGWGTVSARGTIFDISMNLIREHPWLGSGRLNFQLYGETYFSHAHNLFLMKAIEMGIPAALCFTGVLLLLVAIPWWALLVHGRRLAAQGQYFHLLGVTLGVTGFVAMNCFDYNYSHFSLGPMFMALLGIGVAVGLDLPGVAEERYP